MSPATTYYVQIVVTTNTIDGSLDSLAVGNNNSVENAQRVYALGYNNSIDSASSFVAGGDNSVVGDNTNIVLGFSNSTTLAQNFVIGNELTGAGGAMVLGYRNNTSSYPTPNKSLKSLKKSNAIC